MRIFISHSTRDKKFVRTLKDDLQENGFQTWFDEDELDYGDSLIEKLDVAIEKSSHFLIVLSQSSVESDWVKLELKKALALKNKSLLMKVIPVKYRNCELPEEINKLLYADLTQETVVNADNGRVKFLTGEYYKFFSKLIRTLKSSENQITSIEKKEFKKQVEIEEQEKVDELENKLTPLDIIKDQKIIRLYLRVLGFKDKTFLTKYRNIILAKTNISKVKDLASISINPVILPSIIKLYGWNNLIGEELKVRNQYLYEYNVHFGGYKIKAETYTIAIPESARKNLHIQKGKVYLFEFDIANKEISII